MKRRSPAQRRLEREEHLARLRRGAALLLCGLALLLADGMTADGNSTNDTNNCVACNNTTLNPPSGSATCSITGNPIRLGNGTVLDGQADTAFSSPLAQLGFVHNRTYSGQMDASTTFQGPKWYGGYPDFTLEASGSDVLVHIMASATVTFTGASLTPPAGTPWRMVHDTTNDRYRLYDDQTGVILVFYDFTVSPAYLQGRVLEITHQDWEDTKFGWRIVYDPDSSKPLLALAPSDQSYLATFSYSGDDLTQVSLYETTSVPDTEIQRVEFTYKTASHSSDCGAAGTLIQVKSSQLDSSGNWIERYTQYRYYSTGNDLKAVYPPEAIERILQDNANISTPENILTRADSYSTGGTQAISEFAGRDFSYYSSNQSTSSVTTAWGSENLESKYGGTVLDETGFASQETVLVTAGGGGCCGGGAGGGITLQYYYMANSGHSAGNANSVARIVVEDVLDATGTAAYRRIYGISEGGRLLRKVLIDNPTAGTPQYWCESWKVDSNSLLTEYRQVSAHEVTSDSDVSTFLDGHSGTNDSDTLRDNDGVIYVYTNSSEGLRSDTKLKQGESGTAYYVSATDYVGGSDPETKYLVAGTYVYPTQTTTRTAGKKTALTHTYWADDSVKTIKATLPSISSGQNGSGTATETWQYFDEQNRLRWTMDGEGYITYYAYHPEHGDLAYIVQDADPASLPSSASSNSSKWITPSEGDADTNKPTRDANLPTALEQVTTKEFDDEGRLVLLTEPDGAQHYTVYETDRTLQFPYWDSGTNRPLLPIQARVVNDAGERIEEYTVDPARTASSGGVPTGLSAGTSQAHYVSWTRYSYDPEAAQLTTVDRYHDIPSSGTGTLSTHFHRTVRTYDDLGRQEVTVQVVSGTSTSSSVEQVEQQVYDVLDRVTEVKRGVSATGHNMGSSYTTLPTLASVSWTEYDSGGVGDGHVTLSLAFHNTGSTNNTGMAYHRDFRGLVRGTTSYHTYNTSTGSGTALGPYQVQDVDWMGRTVATAAYSSEPTWSTVLADEDYAATITTNRKTLEKTYFDDLGRVYRSESYRVIQATGVADDRTQHDRYYDRQGQVVAEQTAHGSATEMVYDALGRQYETRVVSDLEATKYTSGKFNYRSPLPKPTLSGMTGGDDNLLQFAHAEYDTAGNTIAQHALEMNHADTNGLSLSTTTSFVRSTVYSWYNEAHRLSATGNYGSGDSGDNWKYAAVPARPSSAPASSSASVLLTEYAYDTVSGRLQTVTDPEGQVAKTVYDDLGRTLYAISNYVNFNESTEANTGGTDKSEDQVVKTVYNGLGQVTTLTALDQNADGSLSDNEVTTYAYEDSYNAGLPTTVTYPDSTGGSDVVTMTYYLDGLVKQKTDQRGVVIDYQYRPFFGGRPPEWEKVTTLPGGVDAAVRALKREYDTLRRLARVISYASSTGGTVVNQIEYTYYYNHGLVKDSSQDHNGAVDVNTPYVEYTFDASVTSNVFNDGLRLTNVRAPSGKTISLYYDSTFDDRLNRVSRLGSDHTGSTADRAEYQYNGAGHLVEVEYPGPAVRLRRDEGNGDGTYEHLDRFGRIKSQVWKTGGGTLRDQVNYTYDFNSNRLSRDIPSSLYGTDDQDQLYAYDGLDRLKNFDAGTLSAGSIASPASEQDWTLDGWGNWSNLLEKTGGSTTLNQSRTHNTANEITAIAGVSTYVAHDEAGNMTKVPKPSSWSAAYTLLYDAWNRLVEVKDGANTVATYDYDGLHRRITKTLASGPVEHYYYNEAWQCLEVRASSETGSTQEAYVWHPYYIDALAARFWDDNLDGDYLDANETHYALHDGNYNVTALIDTSGNVLERYGYSPYGKLTVLDASFAADADGLSDVENPYTYTGRRFDPEDGMYYFRNRYYHAQLGRFIRRDPLGYLDGSSLYAAYFACQGTDPFGTSITWSTNSSACHINVELDIVIYPADDAIKQRLSSRTRWNAFAARITLAILSVWNRPGGWPIKCSDYIKETTAYGVTCICEKPFGTLGFSVTVTPDLNSTWLSRLLQDNTIGIVDDPTHRDYVRDGDSGVWDYNSPDWTYAHEAGHLMGLGDRYSDSTGADPGWGGNIMAERGGKPDQRNIDEIVKANGIRCPCCNNVRCCNPPVWFHP